MTREEKLFSILLTIKNINYKSATMIQKVLFIWNQEAKGTWLFVPNNFGPVSFDVIDDMSFLETRNYLFVQQNHNEIIYELTKKGDNILDTLNQKFFDTSNSLLQVVEWANEKGYNYVVRYVYHFYPMFTSKSLIKEKIMEGANDDWIRDAERSKELLNKKLQKSQS